MRSGRNLLAFHPRWSSIAVAAFIVLFISGCGLLGPNEEYRKERGRTVYRSADHSGNEEPPFLPQRKVPGE